MFDMVVAYGLDEDNSPSLRQWSIQRTLMAVQQELDDVRYLMRRWAEQDKAEKPEPPAEA